MRNSISLQSIGGSEHANQNKTPRKTPLGCTIETRPKYGDGPTETPGLAQIGQDHLRESIRTNKEE